MPAFVPPSARASQAREARQRRRPARGSSGAAPSVRASWWWSAIPRLRMPGPSLLDRYVSRIYLRIVGLGFLALLGLFYISTFIDASDKLFKGQATTSTVMHAARLPDAAVRLLRDSDRRAAERAGHLRAAVAHQRADGDEGVRRQSLPRRRCRSCCCRCCSARRSSASTRRSSPARTAAPTPSTLRFAAGRQDCSTPLNRQWVIGRDGSIYHYGYFDPEHDKLTGLVIYRPNETPGRWRRATFAERVDFGTHGRQAATGLDPGLHRQPAELAGVRSRTLGASSRPTTSRPSSRSPT